MPDLNAYLTFNGTCAEAMRFYVATFKGTMTAMMTMGESPMAAKLPAEAAKLIMHARAKIYGHNLMASDCMPGDTYVGMKGMSLTLTYRTPELAKPIFDALAQGGTVTMPLQKTFWAEGFGMLTDRFGTRWMITTSDETT
jgi:PhnB protein